MRSKKRTAALALGIYAGILGTIHGVFQLAQGSSEISGMLIQAIGAPCNPEQVWHACLPALTFAETYRSSGILAIAFSLYALYIILFPNPRRPLAMFLPAVMMLLLGAGFVPAFLAALSGVAMALESRGKTSKNDSKGWRVVSYFWPAAPLLFVIWSTAAWVVGSVYNDVLLSLGFALFLVGDLLLPFLTLLSAVGADHSALHG